MSADIIRKVGDIKDALKANHHIDDDNEQEFYISLEDYHHELKTAIGNYKAISATEDPRPEGEEGAYGDEEPQAPDLLDEIHLDDEVGAGGALGKLKEDFDSGWEGDDSDSDSAWNSSSFTLSEEDYGATHKDIEQVLAEALSDKGLFHMEVVLSGKIRDAAGYEAYAPQPSSRKFLKAIEFFVIEYGLMAFTRDSWADDILPAIVRVPPEPEGPDAPEPEPEPVQGGGRVQWEDLSPPREMERANYRYISDANAVENVYLNVTLSSGFYRAEDSPNTYDARLSAAITPATDAAPSETSALNFYDVFSELGDDATGYMIEETGAVPRAVASIGKIQAIRQALLNRLSEIMRRAEDSKKDLQSAAFRFEESQAFNMATKRLIEIAEIKRQIISDQLDDFVSAIKKRDEYVSHDLYKRGSSGELEVDDLFRTQAFSVSKMLRDPQSELFKSLVKTVTTVVFIDLETQVYRFKNLKNPAKAKFYEGWTSYEVPFSEKIESEIERKVRNFFTKQFVTAWTAKSFCRYLASQISRDTIREAVVNVVTGRVTTSHYYSECSVCGKNIYTRKGKESYGEGRSSTSKGSESYSEYKIQMYGLTKKNTGDLITIGMLQQVDESGAHIKFDPPPILSQGGALPKTWAEIDQMVHSDSKNIHAEGVRRQAWALRSLGAKRVPGGEVPVSDKKFLCPYSNAGDRLAELGAEDLEIKAKDQTCGLKLDLSPIFDSSITTPNAWELQTTSDSQESISGQLERATKEGLITPDAAKDILSELKKRRGGGWKFSNKYFNCPTRIQSDKGSSISSDRMLLDKFSFIASPIAGPVSGDKLSVIELEDGRIEVDQVSSQIYPPSDGLGGHSLPEEGTLSYLVCGSNVSISSFDRGLFAELLKSIITESQADIEGFIEVMISMGVETGDIIPFLSNLSDPEAAIDEINQAGRLDKLSGLLSLAMASPVNLERTVRNTGKSRMEILQDLVLVCRHGHKFSVKDSLLFGRTHTGISLSSRRGASYEKKRIARSGLLSSEGQANFDISRKLLTHQGDSYIVELHPEDLLGPDSERFFEYKEWVDKVDKVKRVAFGVPGSERLYAFGAISRDYIWGSEQRAQWSTARSKETKDSKTTVFIESNVGLEDSMDAVMGPDSPFNSAQGKASMSIQNDGEEFFILGRENEYMKDQAAGVMRLTTPIGEVLSSLLTSCKDFLRMSTTLDIKGRLVGDPVLFRERYDEELEGDLRLIIETLVEGVKSAENKAGIADDAFAIIRGGLLEALYDVDHRFLAYLGKSFHKELITEVSKAILSAANNRGGSPLADKYRRRLFRQGTEGSALDSSSIGEVIVSESGGADDTDSAELRVKDILNRITRALTLSIEDSSKITDPAEASDKIVKMRGQEYMGRVIHGACAFYLADAISKIYNIYMRDASAMAYIGYNIGVDLSSSDKVIGLSDNDMSRVVIGVDPSIAAKIDSLRKQKINFKLKEESAETDFESAWYENHYDNIDGCLQALRSQTAYVMSACTSRTYELKAVAYIRETLREIVAAEIATDGLSDEAVKANSIINNVLTNIPFTSIGMNRDGKYASFHRGSRTVTESKTKSRSKGFEMYDEDISYELMPPFAAVIADYRGPDDYFPIYVLAERGLIHHQFDINISEPPSRNLVYILCKTQIPGSVELTDVDLPAAYSNAGWKVLSIDRGDKAFVFEASSKKSDKKLLKNRGIKEGISLINHPATRAVESDGAVIGYVNEELGLDTTRGFFIGSMSTKSGSDLSFPPTQMGAGVNSVGVPIPLDYGGQDATKNSTEIPIASARIPVSLLGSTPGPMINIEMSDLLQRRPKDEAFQILKEIERVYRSYEAELGEQKVVQIDAPPGTGAGLMESDKARLKSKYKQIIRPLFDQYRGMPYHVVRTGCGTKTSDQKSRAMGESRGSRHSVRDSYYIPFIDFMLMHRFLTKECFSPAWGGHQMWAAEEGIDQENAKRDAIEQFIIDAHGLSIISEELIKLLDKIDGQPGMNVRDIHVTDLLDPYSRLIKTGKLSKEESLKYFGLKLDNIDEFGFVVGFNNNSPSNIIKYFSDWAYSPGQFYHIGQRDSEDRESDCYINVMNIIFPRAKDKERISLVQDPSGSGVMTTGDMYDYTAKIMHGFPTTSRFYPPGGVKTKKTGGVIGAYLYAGAIGEYLRRRMERDLRDIKEQYGAGKTAAVQMLGHIKYSEKLKTDLYRGGIILDTKLYALWSLITK